MLMLIFLIHLLFWGLVFLTHFDLWFLEFLLSSSLRTSSWWIINFLFRRCIFFLSFYRLYFLILYRISTNQLIPFITLVLIISVQMSQFLYPFLNFLSSFGDILFLFFQLLFLKVLPFEHWNNWLREFHMDNRHIRSFLGSFAKEFHNEIP